MGARRRAGFRGTGVDQGRHATLLEELRREGLSAVDSLAQQFDPTVHEAVDTQRVPGLPGNTVVEELRRGYLLHDRLLRPAQVRVCISDDETAAGSDRTGEET